MASPEERASESRNENTGGLMMRLCSFGEALAIFWKVSNVSYQSWIILMNDGVLSWILLSAKSSDDRNGKRGLVVDSPKES